MCFPSQGRCVFAPILSTKHHDGKNKIREHLVLKQKEHRSRGGILPAGIPPPDLEDKDGLGHGLLASLGFLPVGLIADRDFGVLTGGSWPS